MHRLWKVGPDRSVSLGRTDGRCSYGIGPDCPRHRRQPGHRPGDRGRSGQGGIPGRGHRPGLQRPRRDLLLDGLVLRRLRRGRGRERHLHEHLFPEPGFDLHFRCPKNFHVSPFYDREGEYDFHFTLPGDTSLFVAEACSGITSLITLLPIGVFIAYFTDGVTWRRLAIIATVLPIALAGNLLRVILTVLLAIEVDVDFATEGPLHEWAGVATYVLGCLVLLGVGEALRRAFPDRGAAEPAPS